MKRHILAVDDEVDTLNLVRIILESAGYTVEMAEIGREAFEKIDFRKPDLVLLDIRLPEMDGYEICRRLKEDPETKYVPVVMFSASGSEHTAERAREAGADGFLVKPFTMDQLLDAVGQHLG